MLKNLVKKMKITIEFNELDRKVLNENIKNVANWRKLEEAVRRISVFASKFGIIGEGEYKIEE